VAEAARAKGLTLQPGRNGHAGRLATRLAAVESSLPVAERPRRPEWMKVRAPSADSRYFDVKSLIHGASLHTICEEARCPNIAECWGRGTATFQILGDTCTRACRYCYVHSGKPESPPDPLEPLRLANAAAQMDLKHVVVTSVDRDDVPDRGAGHYAATIRALKRKVPAATIEVLTPDFLDIEEEALHTVLAERPDVFNHNIETVRRLHPRMRGAKASYDKALWLLERAKEIADYPVLTKSGIIVGLGETNDEVVETMRDLRANGVDVVTIGQYLQPSPKHAKIDRWVHPDEFRWFREQGEELGFGSVFSGPLVRSSYRADEQRHAAATGRGAVAYSERSYSLAGGSIGSVCPASGSADGGSTGSVGSSAMGPGPNSIVDIASRSGSSSPFCSSNSSGVSSSCCFCSLMRVRIPMQRNL
jgi:lipoyl synthase